MAIADLRFAAWFLWMTPLEAALSSFLAASGRRRPRRLVAGLGGLAELAHGGLQAGLDGLVALVRLSFCLLRLIWDLMFATGGFRVGSGAGYVRGAGARAPARRTRVTAVRSAPKSGRGSAPAAALAQPAPADLALPALRVAEEWRARRDRLLALLRK